MPSQPPTTVLMRFLSAVVNEAPCPSENRPARSLYAQYKRFCAEESQRHRSYADFMQLIEYIDGITIRHPQSHAHCFIEHGTLRTHLEGRGGHDEDAELITAKQRKIDRDRAAAAKARRKTIMASLDAAMQYFSAVANAPDGTKAPPTMGACYEQFLEFCSVRKVSEKRIMPQKAFFALATDTPGVTKQRVKKGTAFCFDRAALKAYLFDGGIYDETAALPATRNAAKGAKMPSGAPSRRKRTPRAQATFLRLMRRHDKAAAAAAPPRLPPLDAPVVDSSSDDEPDEPCDALEGFLSGIVNATERIGKLSETVAYQKFVLFHSQEGFAPKRPPALKHFIAAMRDVPGIASRTSLELGAAYYFDTAALKEYLLQQETYDPDAGLAEHRAPASPRG